MEEKKSKNFLLNYMICGAARCSVKNIKYLWVADTKFCICDITTPLIAMCFSEFIFLQAFEFERYIEDPNLKIDALEKGFPNCVP